MVLSYENDVNLSRPGEKKKRGQKGQARWIIVAKKAF